jgi:hypothetical protein
MDWHLAIEKNCEALKRILAMIFAMVGGTEMRDGVRPTTLPRHLHRFVLSLLRPAEAAARRLVIVAARGLVVELAPPRQQKPKPRSIFVRNGVGTGIVRKGSLQDRASAPPRALALPLFDPLKRFGARRSYVKSSAVPHIRSFDDVRAPLFQQPRRPAPPPPTPDDPLDAGRLHRRLDAIASALDDLPRHAKRLARWQARRDAWLNQEGSGGADRHPTPALRADPPPGGEGSRPVAAKGKPRILRLSPMRPGRPPGWRRRPTHPVHDVLTELHGLAVWAQERPDTS